MTSRLPQIASLLTELGQLGHEDLLEVVEAQDPASAVALRKVIEGAPVSLGRLVCEVVHASALQLGDDALAKRVCAHGFDPRNHREASDRISRMVRLIETYPQLRPVVSGALEQLDSRGVLGLRNLTSVVRMLRIVGHRKGQLRRVGRNLCVADECIERTWLQALGEAYSSHDSSWAMRAVEPTSLPVG